MATTRLDQRFRASTRGQVVALLRRGRRTVDELAGALGLTDNAVRAHLTALERDGLVTQSGVRGGIGKPAAVYDLTAEAEHLFPKAYGAVLRELLDVLADRIPEDELADTMRDVGRRLAAGHQARDVALPERVKRAAALLGTLGGLADIETEDHHFVIAGCRCPLAEAVPGHPEVCLLAETLLAEVVGAPVRQACDPGPPPRCRFLVGDAGPRMSEEGPR